jgi:glycosyltransferase involved in cell wall biosynthesis
VQILQLSLKPPYPKVDGGCIAIAAITEGQLAEDHQVKTLCIETQKHPFNSALVPIEILEQTKMESVFVETALNPLDAFLNLFSSDSYNVSRFYSKAFEHAIEGELKNTAFDVIHLESIFCLPYLETIRSKSKAKVVVRTHNVEHRIWERLAANESNPLKAWYLKLLAGRLKNYELNMLSKVDGIVAITKEDAEAFKLLGISTHSTSIPIGLRLPEIQLNATTESIHLYHLGSMDWEPNVEGVTWFLDEVWPLIQEKFPEVKCTFAGRRMPESLKARSSGNLSILGEVDSASEFSKDKNVALVTLLSGSGMRVKIVEAMALGKTVLTTAVGAEGIQATDKTNILIANTPHDFMNQISYLRSNTDLLHTIGSEARKLAEAEFELSNVSSKLSYFYANL